MSRPVVEFTDFAKAGARRLFVEEWRAQELVWSVGWFLRQNPFDKARASPAFPDRAMWVRTFWAGRDVRVLYETNGVTVVYSIALAPRELR